MQENNKHLLVILVGGSGTGKTTVVKELVSQGHFDKAITCTTRKMREGEQNFVDYVFLDSKEDLFKMYDRGELIETPTEFGGNWYGCPLKSVYRDHPVIAVLEYEGLKKALDLLKNDNSITVAPVFLEPIDESIMVSGLKERGSSEQEIAERVEARKIEASWGDDDNYVLKIKRNLSLSKEESISSTAKMISDLITHYNPTYALKKSKQSNKCI